MSLAGDPLARSRIDLTLRAFSDLARTPETSASRPSLRPGRIGRRALPRGGVALVALLGGARAASAEHRADRLARTPSDVVPGHAHAADLGVPGVSERELRALEARTLGPEHAREHACMRRGDARGARRAAAAAEPDARSRRRRRRRPAGRTWAAGSAAKTQFNVVAIHAALLPTGKVMFFSYPTYPQGGNNAEAWLWNPADGVAGAEGPAAAEGPPANIWCAGQTFTAAGELVVFGGNLEFPTYDAQGNQLTTWKGSTRSTRSTP